MISKCIFIKAWILKSDIHKNMDTYSWMFTIYVSIEEYPCIDILAWISIWISTLGWIIED